MRFIAIAGLLCLAGMGMAQDVQFDYDRSTNFNAYRTYQWVDRQGVDRQGVDRQGVDRQPVPGPNQLMDQNIKRAVDGQLAGKGLRRVESGGELQLAYQAALEHEKQFDAWGAGPRWRGTGHVTTTTIDIGKLVVDVYDPVKKQLVWRGSAEKTLDIKKDPDKNYKNLEKAMAKLFKNYPPGIKN